MSAHTPGPWSVEIDHQTETPEFIRAYHEGEMFDIASLSDETKDIKANARLIAAAPELLAALRDLLAVCPETYDNRHERAAAQDAITRAEEVTE